MLLSKLAVVKITGRAQGNDPESVGNREADKNGQKGREHEEFFPTLESAA